MKYGKLLLLHRLTWKISNVCDTPFTGKRYDDLLAATAFDKWRAASVRYKALKKVIGRLADELVQVGLDAAVLRELLVDSNADPSQQQCTTPAPPVQQSRGTSPSHRNRSLLTARAEYEFAGTPEHPTPRIKITFDSASSSGSGSDDETDEQLLRRLCRTVATTPSVPDDDARNTSPDQEQEQSEEDESRFEELSDTVSDTPGQSEACDDGSNNEEEEEDLLIEKMYGHKIHVPADQVTAPGSRRSSFTLHHRASNDTVRNTHKTLLHAHKRSLSDRTISKLKTADTCAGSEADDESPTTPTKPVTPLPRRRHRHHRVVYVSLQNDVEFFKLLAKALKSLEQLELDQKKQFASQVDTLAASVAQVSSPSKSKNDMYLWRDIFSLWVEAQIFESSREKDRGPRSVEDAESRLQWFVEQVGRKKLAAKLRSKESRATLERFIDLNMTLLDLKRFIEANEEAARKILKKHDKRTALTATEDFPLFRQGSSNTLVLSKDQKAGNLLLPGLPSLPHFLLSTITSVLLPIIPQIDDYMCLICADVAYRPIKLDCGHRFCIRCLVKMQQRKQDACPHCRAPVVLRADGNNIDVVFQQYMELYFPKEVKEKKKLNQKEISAQDFMALTGSESDVVEKKCVIS